jgi:hypothetical protein
LVRIVFAALLVAGMMLVGSAPAAAQEAPSSPAAPAPALPPAAPAPTLPPPTTGSAPPAYGYPPGYAYPPGYGYPPGYSYPPSYAFPQGYGYPPASPPYPQSYAPYPTYAPANAPTTALPDTEPPVVAPAGRWRLGVAAMIVPTGTLSYSLNDRGEAQLAFSGQTASTAGVRPFAQVDILRFKQVRLQLGLAIQILPTIKWANPSLSTAGNDAFSGSGYEVDLLPELAIGVNVLSRVRLAAFAAPGYSFLSASDLASKVYVDPGTVRGFVVQAGAEITGSFGQHFFLDGRLANQWGFQDSEVRSLTNDETWDAKVHTSLFSVQVGCGYWF